MTSARLVAVLAVAGAFGLAARTLEAAPVPRGPSTRAQQSPSSLRADSTDLRQQAEEAQARLERRHRQLLPYSLSGSGGLCREQLGRLCIRREGDHEWTPAPDPPELVQARNELLGELSEIGGVLRGDAWILGQRVRYLSEAGRSAEAVDLAQDCAVVDRWWCSVLEGFALHVMGRYETALEAFAEGLLSMSPEEASKWRDPRILLDGRGSDILAEAEGEDRGRIRSELWILADPLFLMPGNDRESEHYARWTYSKISDGAESVWGMRWGDDLEELTLRYGWERGWEKHLPQLGAASTTSSVTGHQLPGGREFVPPGRVLEASWQIEPGSWIPSDEQPRTAHVAAYAPDFVTGEAQVAVLHRGASIVVAAATRIPETLSSVAEILSGIQTARPAAVTEGPMPWPQPGLLDGPDRVGLFLVGRNGEFHEASRELREGTLEISAPAGDYLVSVEAWSPGEGTAARIRHGISFDTIPDDVATVSDLILLDVGDDLPQDIDVALPMMRPSTRLRPRERIAVGWELFGLGSRPEEVDFELSFYREGEGQGFFARIGGWLGLGGREEPLRIGWEEPGPSEIGPWFRSVEVTLPDLDAGLYALRLKVSTPGREDLVRTRLVEISP